MGALRESLLEGAISEGDGGALSVDGYKGKNDGLEWTGLVGRKRESKGWTGLQKQDCCGTAFITRGVYSEPKEPLSGRD